MSGPHVPICKMYSLTSVPGATPALNSLLWVFTPTPNSTRGPAQVGSLCAHKPGARLEKRDVTGPSTGHREGRPASGHTVRKVGERALWDLESGLAMRIPRLFSFVFGLDASAASVLVLS